jgi:hypothetical protein
MWRCTGLRWTGDGPAWTWWHPARGERDSPIRLGGAIGVGVPDEGVRRCVGVWRGGHRTPCPTDTALAPGVRSDQCERCAALDRSRSVAADTKADDPRPYTVYLAWFGPGVRKVGITAAQRGPVRLLEQAAVCFTFLGRGPLMAARRAESVLGSALGIPDRVPAAVKRAARVALPSAEARKAELRAVHDAALAVPDWRDTLVPLPYGPVDHAGLFGLEPDAPRPVAAVTELAPGTAVSGTLRAVAGGDLYVDTGDGVLLLDTRLVSGWPLATPASGQPPPPVRPLPAAVADVAEPLF